MILETLKTPEGWLARYRAAPDIKDFFIQRYQRQRASLRKAVAAHVTILAGSDSGNPGSFHGPGLIHELELLVTAGGMTPSAAIVSATGAAAKRWETRKLDELSRGHSPTWWFWMKTRKKISAHCATFAPSTWAESSSIVPRC